MTQEEQDALVGRVHRESKLAEAEVQRLLVRASEYVRDIKKLADTIDARIQRAKRAGEQIEIHASVNLPGMKPLLPVTTSDAGIEHIRNFATAVDLDEIDKLDREIGVALAKALQLREQKRQLGI